MGLLAVIVHMAWCGLFSSFPFSIPLTKITTHTKSALGIYWHTGGGVSIYFILYSTLVVRFHVTMFYSLSPEHFPSFESIDRNWGSIPFLYLRSASDFSRQTDQTPFGIGFYYNTLAWSGYESRARLAGHDIRRLDWGSVRIAMLHLTCQHSHGRPPCWVFAG